MAISKVQKHQTRKNLNSTKPKDHKRQEEPPIPTMLKLTNTVFTKIFEHKRQIGTDITGKFLVTSNRGNNYIFVLYEYNMNIILLPPIK